MIDDHVFRREAGRIVSALTRIFGVHNLALAEDVTQDALCRALETWKFHGVPDNPGAWLMATARNRALDVLRRDRTARTFAPDVGRYLESEWTLGPTLDELFRDSAIADDQLRMMFSCCAPRLDEASQVALILHVLCGFGTKEVAHAFLVSRDAMEKRIQRAKTELAAAGTLFDVAREEDVQRRLPGVHRALYLLFNEGYHGAHPDHAVHAELCADALRLAALLCTHAATDVPATHALYALMRLHAARIPSRVGNDGALLPLAVQDRRRWDARSIAEGLAALERASTGATMSEYHVEAAIAAAHATSPSIAETPWGDIVAMYDALFAMNPSPVVALNRAVAIGEAEGPARGLAAMRAIDGAAQLERYPFHAAALGELELRCGHGEAAANAFRRAIACARSPGERAFFEARLQSAIG